MALELVQFILHVLVVQLIFLKDDAELSLMRHIAGVHDGLREITKAKKSVKSEAQANQMSPSPTETADCKHSKAT